MASLANLFRNPPRLTQRWRADIGDHVISLAWAPSGKFLAAASTAGPISLFDSSGKLLRTWQGHSFGTTSISWRNDSALLASGGQDGFVRLWNPEADAAVQTVSAGATWVEHVSWHPTLDLLVSAAGKKLRVWDSSATLKQDYPDHTATISDLAWRPKTHELTSATYGGVYFWSMSRNDPLRAFEWKGSILKLAWSPTATFLAQGNQDSTVHFWIVATGADLQMSGYPCKIRELSWDPSGRYLATGGGDRITVWDCTPPGPADSTPLQFTGHTGNISVLAFQNTGDLLASGGLDGQVILYQPGKYKKLITKANVGGAVSQLVWSPDQHFVGVGSETGVVAVYATL
jgi:WD40 repeat protein